MTVEDSNSPELRVGVTGHRLSRLGNVDLAELAFRTGDVLARISGAAKLHSDARCSLVTNLADGADSILADAALASGWELDAVLPFSRKIYATDFDNPALYAAFAGHLNRARRVLELPGAQESPAVKTMAYERAGRVVISQCDLLIGVWDGQPAQGRGGAAQILAEAVDRGVPVVLVDPAGVRAPELLWNGLDEVEQGEQSLDTVARGPLERLEDLAGVLLGHSSDTLDMQLLTDFESGRPIRGAWLGLAYPLLLRLLGSGGQSSSGKTRDAALAATMLDDGAARAIRQPFSRADRLANAAGKLFRSGYVCNFSLAAFAVLLSMLGLALPTALKPVLIVLEVITIAAILTITRLGNRWHWHRRWLDNRHLAERLRCLEVSVQLGDLDLRGDAGQHAGWSGWYARAVARRAGLPNARVDGAYLETVKSALLTLIDEQAGYLSMDAMRMHRIEHRLHHLGTLLFGATAAICVAMLLFKLAGEFVATHLFETVSHPMLTAGTILSAVLPAIGAAIYGIRMQGDFAGTAERDEALRFHLIGLRKLIAEDPADFDSLQRRTRRVTDLLTAEQSNWLRTYHARPLALPG